MADLLALAFVYCDFVSFPFGILGQVWYLFVSIPDHCCLSSLNYIHSKVRVSCQFLAKCLRYMILSIRTLFMNEYLCAITV